MTTKNMDRDCKLWVVVHQAARALNRYKEKELNDYGITPIESAVMFVVKALKEKATPAEIARWLLREPHTVSGLLIRMEKDGWITKTKDLERKNMIRIAVTKKGEKVHRESARASNAIQLLSCLSEKERDTLLACLEKLRDTALAGPSKKISVPFP